MPADHEAQSQVKEKRRAVAGVKDLRGTLIQRAGTEKIQDRENGHPRAKNRDTSVRNTRDAG